MFGKNTVAETSFRDNERKRSLRQKNWLFIYKKNGKIIVSVAVNLKNTSQRQTFGEMKLKIKKMKKKKIYIHIILFVCEILKKTITKKFHFHGGTNHF